MADIVAAEVTALGSSGDGIAVLNGDAIFIPGAIPGDKVLLRASEKHRAEFVDFVERSPAYTSPVCALAGTCGGCTLQTSTLPDVLNWKTDRVRHALEQAGFLNLPAPFCHQVPKYSRRRLDLAARRTQGHVILGLHQRNGPAVDMTECHIILPELFALLAPLRHVLSTLGALTGEADLQINMLDSGPDILLATDNPLAATDHTKLAHFARERKIARISWRSRRQRNAEAEVVAQHKPVLQAFGPLHIAPPSGAFLQAARAGETAIVEAVLNALPPLNRRDPIIELYAGCGTLTGPLSERGRVIAFEGHTGSLNALKSGTKGARIEPHTRDLVRQPLLAKEMERGRVIVLDPPYTGAGPQMPELARSGVKEVVYISCNPKALQKDAKLLAQAGYEVLSWSVIDQFLWSAECEAVVAFTKDRKRLARR